MGTITEGPNQAHIYLQSDVSGQLDKVLASSEHSSLDNFLEHLIGLFTKASKSTKCIQVRSDVAQKLTALQCETRFQTSDDLMKHLLNLHFEYLKTVSNNNNNNNAKDSRECSVPRKSRKSQPKRNVKHAPLVDSEDSGDPLTSDSREDPWGEVSVSSVESANDNTADLARVKKESHDINAEESKTANKDAVGDAPLCLKQEKSMPPAESHLASSRQFISGGERRRENKRKPNKQAMQSYWKQRSIPLKQEVSHDLSSHGNSFNRKEVTMQEPMENETEKNGDETEVSESERQGYNYVLNSFDASPAPEGLRVNSLPPSPMQVPVKYPKSNSYIISSEDDEPEDLTVANTDQVQDKVTALRSQLTASNGQDNLVKYDSNANAVPAQPFHPNGQFVSPTPIAIPQNLIFHDQPSGSNLVGEPQVLQFAQNTSAVQKATSNGNPPPLLPANPQQLFVTGMQPLQLVSIGGPPPLTSPINIRPGQNFSINLPNAPQMLAAASSSTTVSPQNSTPQQTSVTSPSSGGQSSDGTPNSMKRKRRRVEDTTVFRDQQEASLPFNGPNKYRFYCDVCDTGFTRKYTYNRHKCKGRVEKHYCQLCDKAYLSKYKLKDHILVKHEGQTVSCPECGKKFSSRSSMEMHKKQQHEGQFSIFCKVCGKGFNHTGHYYGHMNKHTNTKPFWCQQCGKRFFGSSYLHNHKQVCRGNNDLNYSCNVCDRKFKCELYLKKHMKIHDTTPIISNPNVAKVKDEDLAMAGVKVADANAVNGSIFPDAGQPIFPNGPDVMDSNSNSNEGDLLIDEGSKMDTSDGIQSDVPDVMEAKQAMVA